MEAHFQIVGCVLANRPAAEQIDAFVAQARRERVAVLTKSAQGATFVRFGATDAKLVTMACEAVRAGVAAAAGANAVSAVPRLRFGFAIGTKVTQGPAEYGLDIGTGNVVQANDLAAGAEDGEVLVSPQLAVWLIDWGFALRSRQVPLPGGRMVGACVLELPAGTSASPAPAAASAPEAAPAAEARPAEGPTEPRPRARAAGGLAPLSPVPAAEVAPAPAARAAPARPSAEAMNQVFRALLDQAEEVARRQAEVEARQDAVLGKMTLADEGSLSARHLAELESELQAQVARVESKLDFVERLEQRVGQVQTVLSDIERRLNQQLQRRAEVESLKALCDTLLAQMVEAQPRLEEMSALQQRLLPMATQVSTLSLSLEASQRMLADFEGRLGEVRSGVEGLHGQMDALADREALVQAVKAELDALREVGARSRADLEFVAGREGQLAELRGKVEALLGRAQDTDDQMALLESRRRLVDEVQASAHAVTHTMGDLQIKLELLNEQRVVIEHVGDKVARLDFTVQEAQNTLRALQREREVAERIEQGLKALRARSSAGLAT